MKVFLKTLPAALLILSFGACKKSNSSKTNSSSSPVVGFWTYKEDAANDYWNQNVLFKPDGTFRAYTALSLADTAAANALADTANQVVTFGTYSVKGTSVQMIYSEFNVIGLKFEGSLNSANNNLIGNLESNDPSNAEPLFYLTKQ